METGEARRRFTGARIARLATTGPHLVPCCFAVDGDTVWTAVDAKPKRTTDLRRLRNVTVDPRVALLVDHYDDQDWSRLWWVRADGRARVLADCPEAVALLAERYRQYRDSPPGGPFLEITVTRWSGWAAR